LLYFDFVCVTIVSIFIVTFEVHLVLREFASVSPITVYWTVQ